MNITEVRIKAMNAKNEKLKAFASITIEDDFVVRDLKVIVGSRGLFVAMPSRKLSDYCPKCRSKNALRSKFCSDCGNDLRKSNFGKGRSVEDEGERSNLHADIAHPVNSECRDLIQDTVVKAYELAVAFPDNRGIFTADEIANTDVPESVEEEIYGESCGCDCDCDEQEQTEECAKPEEECCCAAPEESIQETVTQITPEPTPEPQPTAEAAPAEEPSFEAAAKESTLEERQEETTKKKRRFGLGIFS